MSNSAAIRDFELSLLRHAHLPRQLTFELEGGARYTATLATEPHALAPAYEVRDQAGRCKQVVLPSLLEDVELHLLAWVTVWDRAISARAWPVPLAGDASHRRG